LHAQIYKYGESSSGGLGVRWGLSYGKKAAMCDAAADCLSPAAKTTPRAEYAYIPMTPRN
jgi:hypothetical protein